MNKFLVLIRVQVIRLLHASVNVNTAGRKKNNKKDFSGLLVFLFPALISLYMSGTYTFAFSHELSVSDYYLFPLMGVALAYLLSFILSVFLVDGHLFKNKDYELLSTLPFTKQEIFTSKLLSLYLYQLIYAFFMMLIPAGFYLYHDFNVIRLLFIILTVLLEPFFLLIAVSILGMIISYLSSFFRNKTFFTIALYLILVVGLIAGTNTLTSSSTLTTIDDLVLIIKETLPLFYYLLMGIKNCDFFYFGLFAFYSIASLVAFIMIFAFAFDSINKKLHRVRKNKVKALTNESFNTNGIKKTLLLREIKHYLHSPMYVLNTVIGPVMLVISACSLFFLDSQMLMMFQMYEEIQLLIFLGICLMNTITSTTNVSISLEGQSIYLLKTLPINYIHLFNAKIALNLLMEFGLTSIAIILYSIALRPNILMVIIMMAFNFAICFYNSYVGLIINLFNPLLDFTNEAVVVKQSKSVLLSMLAGFIATIIFGGIGYVMFAYLGLETLVIIVILTFIILSLAMYLRKLTNAKGIELFIKL